MRLLLLLIPSVLGVTLLSSARASSDETGVFYSPLVVERMRANVKSLPGAANIAKAAVAAAQPWMKFSDDELWGLMFGHTISRSWMVWSDGYCPACKQSVPMYQWKMDALETPWKVCCPHCGELFPKNDFYAFYRSGLDERAVFDPSKADRSLLFNAEHPDPNDPLHTFGVDDGEGYVEGDHRWRFIGAYLIYGQWSQVVLEGIRRLSVAYVLTGDPTYAYKAAILLDRVADLYPTFDFGKEGFVYESPVTRGYVSIWHNACPETRDMALAYDRIRGAIHDDQVLVSFLSQKASQCHLDNPKASPEDIQRNIKERILLDAVNNRSKIETNYPQTDMAILTLKMVLGWPENRAEVEAGIDDMLDVATAADGVSGEKGLSGYAYIAPATIAVFLQQCSVVEPSFLRDLFARHPSLRQTYRFHIDTWCLQRYYPLSGDCGGFAQQASRYMGATFQNAVADPISAPSMYSFFWQLYQLTGDPAYVQVMYGANGNKVEGMPYDLFCEDAAAFQREVADVVAREGTVPKLGSVNKQQWHLAILRAGEGKDARAVWLDYDSGGGHGHFDGMNLGLFAKGLDLMPDFGYPPVQYGGWTSPRGQWYGKTAAHNTVAVNGENQQSGWDQANVPPGAAPGEVIRIALNVLVAGHTTIWADGKTFRAIRASGPDIIAGKRHEVAGRPEPVEGQFERTVAMADVSESDSYIADVFRVVGGADHAKFTGSHFAKITTQGLSLSSAEDYGYDTQMRNFQADRAATPGWSVDWKIDDRYGYLAKDADVHLRYTDLTEGAEASTCEAWVNAPAYMDETWIPRVMVRRRADVAPLSSTFVDIIEPYEGASNIAAIHRLSLETADGKPYPDTCLAVEIGLADGRRDLLVSADVENPLGLSPSLSEGGKMVQKEWGLATNGELCWVRLNADGEIERVALCHGNEVSVKGVTLKLKQPADFIEIRFDNGVPSVVSGNPDDVSEVLIGGGNVWRP